MAAQDDRNTNRISFGDLPFGCIGFVTLQVAGSFVFALLLMPFLYDHKPDGLQTVSKFISIRLGVAGFAIGCRWSIARRQLPSSQKSQQHSTEGVPMTNSKSRSALMSMAVLAGLLVVLAGLGTAYLTPTKSDAAPAPTSSLQNLRAIQIEVLNGEHQEWDVDPFEGMVQVSATDGTIVQTVNWVRGTSIDAGRVDALINLSLAQLEAMISRFPDAPPIRSLGSTRQVSIGGEGAGVVGYSWELGNEQRDFVMYKSVWNCPGSDLLVEYTTVALQQEAVLLASSLQMAGLGTAACLAEGVTAKPPKPFAVSLPRKGWHLEGERGGVEQWRSTDQLSSLIVWGKKTSKISKILAAGLSCGDFLTASGKDFLSRQGAVLDPAQSIVVEPTDAGCLARAGAVLSSEGTQVPLLAAFEMRDCSNGFFGFATLLTAKDRFPAELPTLWSCADPAPGDPVLPVR